MRSEVVGVTVLQDFTASQTWAAQSSTSYPRSSKLAAGLLWPHLNSVHQRPQQAKAGLEWRATEAI